MCIMCATTRPHHAKGLCDLCYHKTRTGGLCTECGGPRSRWSKSLCIMCARGRCGEKGKNVHARVDPDDHAAIWQKAKHDHTTFTEALNTIIVWGLEVQEGYR